MEVEGGERERQEEGGEVRREGIPGPEDTA